MVVALTQVVMPTLPALLARPSQDTVLGNHALFDDRPVFCAMLRHELTHSVIVRVCPRSTTEGREHAESRAVLARHAVLVQWGCPGRKSFSAASTHIPWGFVGMVGFDFTLLTLMGASPGCERDDRGHPAWEKPT